MSAIRKFYGEIKNQVISKNHILHYTSLKIHDGEVNLHWYHSELEKACDLASNNLGDTLSPYIVGWILRSLGLNAKNLKTTKNLYAVGSIILMGAQDATIWGSGLPYFPNGLKSFFHSRAKRKLDIRLVRGPKSRECLINLGHFCPPNFADPGVLLPLIYKPLKQKRYKVTYIPHYSKVDEAKELYTDMNILDMRTNKIESVIDEICASEKIVSSSLHGIIIAESYGIPAVFLQDRSDALNFKYADWYESTCRKDFPIAKNMDEALQIDFQLPLNIAQMQMTALDTFPIDLYETESLAEVKYKMLSLMRADKKLISEKSRGGGTRV